jgi:hypothetical protein
MLAGVNTPGIGLAWNLEKNQVPQADDIEREARALAATYA